MPAYDKRDYSYRFLNTEKKKKRVVESDTDDDMEQQREEEYRKDMSEAHLTDASIEIYMAMKKFVRERGSPLLDSINFNSVMVRALLTGERF
jgi:hypothetical protein